MKEMLEYIVKMLVDNPDDVRITEAEKNGLIKYKIEAGERELGKIIGKKGRNARALRTLLIAAATKLGKRVSLEIPDKVYNDSEVS